MTFQSTFNKLQNHIAQNKQHLMVLAVGFAFAMLMALAPEHAYAQNAFSSNTSFITNLGCDFVKYLQGPLGIVVFLVVVAITLVGGMWAGVKWEVLIGACVIFGILIGLTKILLGSGYVNVSGLEACLN